MMRQGGKLTIYRNMGDSSRTRKPSSRIRSWPMRTKIMALMGISMVSWRTLLLLRHKAQMPNLIWMHSKRTSLRLADFHKNSKAKQFTITRQHRLKQCATTISPKSLTKLRIPLDWELTKSTKAINKFLAFQGKMKNWVTWMEIFEQTLNTAVSISKTYRFWIPM